MANTDIDLNVMAVRVFKAFSDSMGEGPFSYGPRNKDNQINVAFCIPDSALVPVREDDDPLAALNARYLKICGEELAYRAKSKGWRVFGDIPFPADGIGTSSVSVKKDGLCLRGVESHQIAPHAEYVAFPEIPFPRRILRFDVSGDVA